MDTKMNDMLRFFLLAATGFLISVEPVHPADNPRPQPKKADWSHDLFAVVTPDARTVFVVTNFEKITLQMVGELQGQGTNPANGRVLSKGSPELIFF